MQQNKTNTTLRDLNVKKVENKLLAALSSDLTQAAHGPIVKLRLVGRIMYSAHLFTM